MLGTWLYSVNIRQYWLALGCTWSLEGGQYLVVLGQNRVELVASVICFQKTYGLHGLKHQIIEYLKKEKLMTDKRTNRQSFLL